MQVCQQLGLLTGAASGIGAATARLLAVQGADLALVDRDAAGLAALADELRLFGVKVSTHEVDLADGAAIPALPDAVKAAHGRAANLLINNAGVALVGRFDQTEAEAFDWLMRINFEAGVRLTRAMLADLLAAPQARIVFISSVFGIIASAGQTAYCASKFAIRGFAESLRHELSDTTVGVTVVHPGGIRTNIARRARVTAGVDPIAAQAGIKAFEVALVTPPEVAARRIVEAILRDRPRLLIGPDAQAIDVIQRVLPVRYWSLINRRLGKMANLVKTPAATR
jgi:short-subunit dehydrogenase